MPTTIRTFATSHPNASSAMKSGHSLERGEERSPRKRWAWGDVWTWTALDADTKLMISYAVGNRGANSKLLYAGLASRVASRIQITTDGHKVYAHADEGAFGADVDYAMLIKLFGNDSFDLRYSSGDCIGTCTAVLAGSPDPLHISTSFVERQNLAMRMSIRRFARLTNAFSKKVDNHAAAIALHFMHYNFCRVHKTLRVTPMEAGLAHRVWTVEELVSIIPEPVAKSRGPYRPRIQGDAQPTLTGDRRLRTPASLSTNIFSFKALQYKTPFIAGVHRFKTETPSPKNRSRLKIWTRTFAPGYGGLAPGA